LLLPKFLSRKKLSRKYRSIFGLKNRSRDRRNVRERIIVKTASPAKFDGKKTFCTALHSLSYI